MHFIPNTNGNRVMVRKDVAFSGAAGNGAVGTVALFVVTGAALIRVANFCTEDLASAGGGSVSEGIAGNAATFIPATLATDIDNAEAWVDNAPSTGELLASQYKLVRNATIALTVTTADISDGTLECYAECILAPGASVVPA